MTTTDKQHPFRDTFAPSLGSLDQPEEESGRKYRKIRTKSDAIRPEDVAGDINFETYTIQNLYDMRSHIKLPAFQRGKAWTREMEKGIVDSIWRRMPIPSFLIYREPAWEGGNDWLIDALQRFNSITGFMGSKFPTFTQKQLEHWRPNTKLKAPIPGLTWGQLGEDWKSYFKKYKLSVIVVTDIDMAMLAEIFFRLQIHKPLSLGETLYAYDSQTATAVQHVFDHNFWRVVYNNRNEHQERVPEALSIIVMEIFNATQGSPIISLSKPNLIRAAAGVYDGRVNKMLVERVSAKMTRAAHVFYGAESSSRLEIAAIWQAATELEKRGFDLERSEQGCLAPVLRQWKHGALHKNGSVSEEKREEFNSIAHLGSTKKQKEFWEQYLGPLERTAGLVKRDIPWN